MSRLLGLDLGDHRIGVAVADLATGAIRPLTTLRRGALAADAARLARLAAEQDATELVVGLPLDMQGGEGEQAGKTRTWAAEMTARTGLRLGWRDERLTTAAAESRQPALHRHRETGRPTRSSILARRARVDQEAAVLILRAELDVRGTAQGDRSRVDLPDTGPAAG
ncbi:MAG: Holliday junction resolvase RuvX [Candidatus Limnocylindrales bacterium]